MVGKNTLKLWKKNIVKAFKRDLTTCKLQFGLRLRLLNNSNLSTHNANSLVTSDLPWHKSRNKILTTVHSVIWPYEVNSQFPPPTLTQNPSATLRLKIQLINPAYLQLASLGIKHFLRKVVE